MKSKDSEPIVAQFADGSPPPKRRRKLPQFSIFSLMVLTFVVAVGVTPAYYIIRAANGETGYRAVAVLMGVALPVMIMIAISTFLSVQRWLSRRRR